MRKIELTTIEIPRGVVNRWRREHNGGGSARIPRPSTEAAVRAEAPNPENESM